MKQPKILYVIADGGRARFVARGEEGDFHTIASFVSSEIYERSHDLGTDRPTRVHESANAARHAAQPRHDLHSAAKEDFVKHIASEIDGEQERGRFEKLVLVAPPRVLTELKEKLSKSMARLVADGLQKDLTKVPDHELAPHLAPPLR